MRHRLATYVPVRFPYPMTYESDGGGGLHLVPAMRTPTAVVQAAHHGCRCGGACKRRPGLGDDITDALQPTSDSSGGGQNWASLIGAGANAIGTVIASTRGIGPQQFAAQNRPILPPVVIPPASQFSLGSGLSSTLLGVPIWGWGLGVLAAAALVAGGRR